MDPTFDSKRLSLLDRGWVFGIAHSEFAEGLP
jgi:protease II